MPDAAPFAADPAAAFIEEVGLSFQADGRPRIAGRMLGLLIVEGRALSLKEIAARLQVSRASVSTNARLLAEDGLIYRSAVAGDRQDYYRLVADPYGRLLRAFERRMRAGGAGLAVAAAALPDPEARARAGELAAFRERVADLFAAHIEEGTRNGAPAPTLGKARPSMRSKMEKRP